MIKRKCCPKCISENVTVTVEYKISYEEEKYLPYDFFFTGECNSCGHQQITATSFTEHNALIERWSERCEENGVFECPNCHGNNIYVTYEMHEYLGPEFTAYCENCEASCNDWFVFKDRWVYFTGQGIDDMK